MGAGTNSKVCPLIIILPLEYGSTLVRIRNSSQRQTDKIQRKIRFWNRFYNSNMSSRHEFKFAWDSVCISWISDSNFALHFKRVRHNWVLPAPQSPVLVPDVSWTQPNLKLYPSIDSILQRNLVIFYNLSYFKLLTKIKSFSGGKARRRWRSSNLTPALSLSIPTNNSSRTFW